MNTSAQLNRIVKGWQKRLKLEHFKIEIVWDEPPVDTEAWASVSTSDSYDQAALRFDPTWKEWPIERLNYVVVHELIHILFRDLEQAANSSWSSLSRDAHNAAYDRWMHELEGVTDRLANRIVEVSDPIF